MGYHLTESALDSRKRPSAIFSDTPKTHTPGSRLQGLGRRSYSPSLGRWFNRDPIGEETFWSGFSARLDWRGRVHFSRQRLLPTYMFCLNDGMSRIDLLGLLGIDPSCNDNKDPIESAIKSACETVKDAKFACCMNNFKHGTLLRQLKDACAATSAYKVRCKKTDEYCKTSDGKNRCGFAPLSGAPPPFKDLPAGPYLCPAAFTPECGCLGDTIIEELVHKLTDKAGHKEVSDVLKCMEGKGCGKGGCKTCK